MFFQIPEDKNQISHRGKALEAMKKALKEEEAGK
jgi:inosine/xanthosine triphosphate pyrophosphatase family protein